MRISPGMRRGLVRGWLVGLLGLVLTGVGGLPTEAEPRTDQPDVIVLDGTRTSVSLVPRSWVLAAEGALSPAQAAARLVEPGVAVETAVRSHGYVRDILWARASLSVAPEAAGQWYLSLQVPNFDMLDVFRLDPDGAPPELLFTLGDRVPPVTEIASRSTSPRWI